MIVNCMSQNISCCCLSHVFNVKASAADTSVRPEPEAKATASVPETHQAPQSAADAEDIAGSVASDAEASSAQADVSIGPSMPAMPTADAADADSADAPSADAADIPEVQPAAGLTC